MGAGHRELPEHRVLAAAALRVLGASDRDIFRKAAAGVDLACRRVEQLKAELRGNGASAPDTDMHLLVEQSGYSGLVYCRRMDDW